MVKKLLIYNSGGGIGDSIQLFPLILSLKNLFKNSEIYYLGAHENHYSGKLKEYNIKVKTLDLSRHLYLQVLLPSNCFLPNVNMSTLLIC